MPKIQVAAEASKQEGELAKLLAEARAKVAEYSTAPAAKRERRVINNNITVHVQQIAATRQQIEKKAVDIAQFLNGFQAGSIQRTFATISLAKRVLTQCDSQVSKLNRFAFALAEVSVRVAVFDATFGQVLIALLHEACVLAVPKYYPCSSRAGTPATTSTSSSWDTSPPRSSRTIYPRRAAKAGDDG